jgi:hypothetical protein
MQVAERAQHYLGDISGPEGEGRVTTLIESQMAKLPSGTYLSLGLGAMAISWIPMMAGKRHVANFVGQWVPTLLIIGLYNKLTRVVAAHRAWRDHHAARRRHDWNAREQRRDPLAQSPFTIPVDHGGGVISAAVVVWAMRLDEAVRSHGPACYPRPRCRPPLSGSSWPPPCCMPAGTRSASAAAIRCASSTWPRRSPRPS